MGLLLGMSKGGIDKLTVQELIEHMKEALKIVEFKGLIMKSAIRNIDIIDGRGSRSEKFCIEHLSHVLFDERDSVGFREAFD